MTNKHYQKKLEELIYFLKNNNLELNLKIEQDFHTLELKKIEIEFFNSEETIHKMTYDLKISPDNETFYKAEGLLYKEKTASLNRCYGIPIFGREAYILARKDFLSLKMIAKNYKYTAV